MRYWTRDGTTALYRFDGIGTFHYLDRRGNWVERNALIAKIHEPDVDAIDDGTAAVIAAGRYASL
jgi:hypothetical protein